MSAIVNRGLPLKAYVFRNYRLMPGVRSHYLGDCKHKMWQAIRASSAAPGYFQEFVLGKDLHQVRHGELEIRLIMREKRGSDDTSCSIGAFSRINQHMRI